MERIIPTKTRQQLMMLIILIGVVASFGIGVLDYLSSHQPLAVRAFLLYPLLISIILLLVVASSRMLRTILAQVDLIESQIELFLADANTPAKQVHTVRSYNSTTVLWNRFVDRIQHWMSLEELHRELSQRLVVKHEYPYADVLNMLPIGIAYVDDSGRILLYNHAFIQMLILEKMHLTTIDAVLDHVRPNITKANQNVSDSSWKSNGPLSVVLEMKCDGAIDYVHLTRRPYVVDQKVKGSLFLLRDITQQRISEVSRDDFLSTATHELRTPLANIIAYAETLTLNETIDIENQKHFCNVIKTEAFRLSRFVDELLDVNRMEAGSLTLHLNETDTQRLLSDISDKVRPQMLSKQITFDCQFPIKVPKLIIDKDKVSAALINMLGNAAKYTPSGGRVEFRVVSLEHFICFEVHDSGFGIAPEELPKVFDKFFRSDDERVRDITGSGLGLSFTREVVRLHGGDISAQSELGKGSVFIMTLPRPQEVNHV